MTKLQRLTMVLTVFNFMCLACAVAELRPAVAQGVVPILRGR